MAMTSLMCWQDQVFRCKDGFVAIAALDDEQFKGLCQAMEKTELIREDRFQDISARVEEEHNIELYGIISDWTLSKTKQEIENLADKYEFPANRISNAQDHYHDEHLRRRGAVWEFDDPLYGKVVEYGPGPKLSESPGRMKWFTRPIGFHNEHIFRDVLNLSQEEMQQLQEEQVIGKWMDRVGAKPPDDWNEKDGLFF